MRHPLARKFLPVFKSGTVDSQQRLHHLAAAVGFASQIVARPEHTAHVKIARQVDAPFLALGKQVVKLVHLRRIERQRIGSLFIKHPVIVMVEPDRVVTEPGHVIDHRVDRLLVEEVGTHAEVGSEEADPLVRGVFKGEAPVGRAPDEAVLSGRRIQHSGEVERTARNNLPIEGVGLPHAARLDDQRTVLCHRETDEPVAQRNGGDHPAGVRSRTAEGYRNRLLSGERKTRGVKSHRTGVVLQPDRHRRIGQR